MMSFNSGTSEDNSLFWERHKASSIIISAALFLLLTFFCMWKFCSYGGPRASSSRNQPSMGDFSEPDPDPDDHHHSIQIQGLGLELWVVSSLPTSQFKKNEGSNKECAICLAEFEEEEWVKRLPSCAHVFHVSCIATWFRSRSNCPICRANVNHQDHLALSLESSDSNYASPDETLSREELSRERPSQLGSHTTTLQPASCTN